jgi:cell division protein FtsB
MRPSSSSRSATDAPIEQLKRRVNQLEAQLEGFQDAMHRDAVRRDDRESQI